MESRTKLMGHPVHPMLIVFPLGLLIASLVFDIAYFITGNEFFPVVSYYNIIGGLIGGAVAAIFGLRDYLAIPSGTRAKTVGGWHGIGNALILVLFFIGWLMRMNSVDFAPGALPFILSLLAILLGTVTAWLGGEMVDRLGVGVDRGANLNAPNSLSGQPATFTPGAHTPAAVPVTGGEKYREKHIDKNMPGDASVEPKVGPDADRDTNEMDR